MTDDLALVVRAVGPFDGVEPERQRPALMDDPRLDRRLVQLRVGGAVVERIDGSLPWSAGRVGG